METQRFEIYSCNEFLFEGSYSNEELFLHVEVKDWRPSVLKKLYRVFGWFLDNCEKRGVKRLYTASPNSRFVKLFNGVSLGTVTEKGKEYEVFIWELK